MASSPQASVELRSALALLYLQIGDVKASEYHLQIVDSSTDEKTKALRVHNQVMRAAFMADWETCTRLLVGRLDDVSTREDHVQRAMASICFLILEIGLCLSSILGCK
jgi:FtsZ-binding cell division protein ZapB